MGPKKDKGDGHTKEVIVGGKNLASLTDEQLLEFQQEFSQRLHETEKENALLEVELNMLRNAWKMTEDKVSEIELENVIIRREMDMAKEKMEPSQWQDNSTDYDKRVLFDKVKQRIKALDEGPDDVINLGSDPASAFSDPEEMYASKPRDMEERYEAQKKTIAKDKRLKSKKAKFDAKVNEMLAIQASMEEASEEDRSTSQQLSHTNDATAKESLPITPSTVQGASLTPNPKYGLITSTNDGLLDLKTLENIVLEEGSISTGSVSDKTAHSIVDIPNIVDDALADRPLNKRHQLDSLQQAIINHNYLQGRKWDRADPRYDDSNSCGSPHIDSDDDHIFDDFNPMHEEDVNDAVHYYQMRKWLEYDYETLVDEMKKRVDRRIKAINYVWTKDVEDVMSAQVKAAEDYDINLRDQVRRKIEKEVDRTKRNEEHLKLLLQGLEEVRIKMIRERYATNMGIVKQQTEELNYLVQESYDRTINELKASTKFNLNLTQMFFMRSTENDISLIHELHSKQKKVQDHVDKMKIQVEKAKKEVAQMKAPLEEQERFARWMETTIAALHKDMRSKKDQEKTNSQLSKAIENIEDETGKLKMKNMAINSSMDQLRLTFDEIIDFREKYTSGNSFCRRLNELTRMNENKITRLRKKLKEKINVEKSSWRLIRRQVLKNVLRCNNKKWHNLLETKAFNELVTQFDIRARQAHMKSYAGIDKLAIPYRKTSANIITTFDENKKLSFPLSSRKRHG